MATTLDLQEKLKTILGSNNVYFQPPSGFKMHYPCFVVNRHGITQFDADNSTYIYTKCYDVTYISYDEDPDMVDTMLKSFSMIKYGRPFVTDNLYHDTFTLYW